MLETISDLFGEAYRRNWITARDGNASIRWNDRDHMYITPSGIRNQTLQPEMFIKWNITRRKNSNGTSGRTFNYVRKTSRPYNKKAK